MDLLPSFDHLGHAASRFWDDRSPVALLVCCSALFVLRLVYRRVTRASRLRRHFNDRHVWVVGASQGLGRALCIRLHELGSRLTISSRSVARLEKVSAECGDCKVLPLDVAASSVVIQKAWLDASRACPVECIIANAGVNHKGKRFAQLESSEIDCVLDTNIRGIAHLFHSAITNGMRAGTLCAVSSLAAYRGVPGASVYGASKAALTTMCQSLNVELLVDKRNLNVVAVHPGFVDTPAIRGLDHPKPLLLTEEQAAELILDAIATGQRHYGFPWLMEHVVMRFSRALPSPFYDYLLHYTSD